MVSHRRRILVSSTRWSGMRRTRVDSEKPPASIARPDPRTLEEKFPDIVVSQPEIVAYHYAEAGLVEPAIGYWLKAGNLALSRSTNAAVGHLKQGLKQISNIDDPMRRNKWELLLQTSLGNSLRST